MITKIMNILNQLNISKYKIIEHRIDKFIINFKGKISKQSKLTNRYLLIYFLHKGGLGKLKIETTNIDIIEDLIINIIKNNYLVYDINNETLFITFSEKKFYDSKVVKYNQNFINEKRLNVWIKNEVFKFEQENNLNECEGEFILYKHINDTHFYNGIAVRNIVYYNNIMIETDSYDSYSNSNIKLYNSLNLKKDNNGGNYYIDNVNYKLKGKVKFEKNVLAYILNMMLNAFEAKNVLNNKVFITKDLKNSRLFDIGIDIVDDPQNIRFNKRTIDDQGSICMKMHIIEGGYLRNFYVDEQTRKHFKQINGNAFLNIESGDVSITPSITIVNMNLKTKNDYNILVYDIIKDECVFDFANGNMKLSLIGNINGCGKVNKYIFEKNIISFIDSSIYKSSNNGWVQTMYLPDIILNL